MAYSGASYGGYNAYKQVGVKTASQGKLVVMLYEGAVSHVEKAIALIGPDGKIKANSIESFGNHNHIIKDLCIETTILRFDDNIINNQRILFCRMIRLIVVINNWIIDM